MTGNNQVYLKHTLEESFTKVGIQGLQFLNSCVIRFESLFNRR